MRTLLRSLRFEALWVGVVLLLAVGIVRTNETLEGYSEESPAHGLGPLPDGDALRVLSLGFDRLVADLFWVRTVFHVGDERTAQQGYPGLYVLADLVTDIDPTFRTVYVVMSGGIAALERNPDGAIALLEKGAKHVDYWKVHFLLGMSYFLERFDYASAAEQLEIAAEKGGPPHLPLLASRLYASAGERETALAFVQARLREEKHPATRAALEKRYWDLWITRDLSQLDSAIAAFRERAGRTPERIEELLQAGVLAEEPRDPRGGHYYLVDGRAATDLEYETLEPHIPYRPDAPKEVERQYRDLRRKHGEESTP